MTILDRPPKDWKRPGTPPLGVQVQVLLRQLEEATGKPFTKGVDWEHRPAVWERKFDDAAWDTVPAFFDPKFLEAMIPAEHDQRTFGRKPDAAKTVTTAGSDANRRAKARALTKDQEEFRRKVLERPCGGKRQPTGNWPKGRKLQGRGFERRRS